MQLACYLETIAHTADAIRADLAGATLTMTGEREAFATLAARLAQLAATARAAADLPQALAIVASQARALAAALDPSQTDDAGDGATAPGGPR